MRPGGRPRRRAGALELMQELESGVLLDGAVLLNLRNELTDQIAALFAATSEEVDIALELQDGLIEAVEVGVQDGLFSIEALHDAEDALNVALVGVDRLVFVRRHGGDHS